MKLEEERKKVLATQPKKVKSNHHYSYSFATSDFQPSKVAVHPKDNTEEVEPTMPGMSMALAIGGPIDQEPSVL